MVTNTTTIAPTPTTLGLRHRKVGRRIRRHHKVGRVEEGGATAVVMDLPRMVGITTGPHQAAHHHLVIRRRLDPAPLPPGPLTNLRTT